MEKKLVHKGPCSVCLEPNMRNEYKIIDNGKGTIKYSVLVEENCTKCDHNYMRIQ
jgi:hypothetical protein